MNISGGIKISGSVAVQCNLTPPKAPTISSAIWNTGTTSTRVIYTAPANNGGFPITSYQITSNCGAISTTSNSAGTVTLNGLTPGNTYTFKVAAINLRGLGCYSCQSSSITAGTIPGAPTGVSSTATSCATHAVVSYTAPTNNGGFPITSYTAISTPGNITATVATSASGSITVLGLTQGSYYSFNVYATNLVGNSALSSTSTSAPEGVVPNAPTGISVTNTIGTTVATVYYTAPASNGGFPITSYTAISTPGNITATVATSASGSITVNGLSLGSSYTFKVYATNLIGDGAQSTASNTIQLATLPGVPTGVSATADNSTQITITYTAPTNTGYTNITSYTSVVNPGNIITTVYTSASGTIVVGGLNQTTTYSYRVYATNAVGNGPASSTSTVTTPVTPLSVNYLIVAGGGSGGLGVGSGGGAGGLLAGTVTLTPGSVNTIVVGGGGGAISGTISRNGNNGNNSSAFGYTAIGGGYGAQNSNGGPGGSGGGGGGGCGAGHSYGGGCGTSGQGYPGGAVPRGYNDHPSGGGGGAGGPGSAFISCSQSGPGGPGAVTTLITPCIASAYGVGAVCGSNVYFAGGGGGGIKHCTGCAGGGGVGGGGYGSRTGAASGSAHSGGGGGGSGNPGTAGGGGSGVVILSVPTSAWHGSYTGACTVSTTNGSNTVIIFKGGGSFTA